MNLSRTAVLFGLLVLNACSVGTVTASSAHEGGVLIGAPNWGREANSVAAADHVAPAQVDRATTHTVQVERFRR